MRRTRPISIIRNKSTKGTEKINIYVKGTRNSIEINHNEMWLFIFMKRYGVKTGLLLSALPNHYTQATIANFCRAKGKKFVDSTFGQMGIYSGIPSISTGGKSGF